MRDAITHIRRRAAGATLLLVHLFGCTSWKTRPEGPGPVLAERPQEVMRVTLADGRREELQAPRIEGDSLIGMKHQSRPLRVAYALSDVSEVAVLRVNAGKTVLAFGVGVTVLVVVLAALAYEPGGLGGGGSGSWGGGGSCTACVSCPLVYSWDGSNWRLDSGTFGGAITRGLQRTDRDNLDYPVAPDGTVRLRLAAELMETDYVDQLGLLAIDHEPGWSIAPDGRGRLHTAGRLESPITARDYSGADALARLRDLDGWHWESSLGAWGPEGNGGIRDGVELAFLRDPSAREARLVVDGRNTPWSSFLLTQLVTAHGPERAAWYDSLDNLPAVARRTAARISAEAFLAVQVLGDTGWERQALVWEAGPEVGKRQVAVLDLSRVSGDTLRVRLEAPPAFWLLDHVSLSQGPETPFTVTRLAAASATDAGGQELKDRIAAVDSAYLTMVRGDRVDLTFQVPEVPAGMVRSYVLESNGYYVVDVPADPVADRATLDRLDREPGGVSRVASERLRLALIGLASRSRQ